MQKGTSSVPFLLLGVYYSEFIVRTALLLRNDRLHFDLNQEIVVYKF